MGYFYKIKIRDLKEEINNSIYDYFNTHGHQLSQDGNVLTDDLCDDFAEDLCDRVEKLFEKVER